MSFFSSFSFLIAVCAAIVFCCTGNNNTDRLALLQFKGGITDDPLGVMRSWNHSRHFCKWNGVTCDRKHLRVTHLSLESSKLSGTLSPFVGNLSFLGFLSLENNSISGIIPPEIGRLHKLEYLFLDNNSFRGEIPSNISGCSNLIKLILNDNNLSGAILPEIGTLPNLQYLDLGYNKLSGAIPAGFGTLSNLQYLELEYNKLSGGIPPEIGALSNLNVLALGNNKLTGLIPPSLANLTSLSVFYMSSNNLIGTIPDGLGKLETLTEIDAAVNNFSGTIPLSIYNLSSLTYLDLGANKLEGTLPSDLGNMLPYLEFFSLRDNQFAGSIPASISNSSNIYNLQLNDNNFHGQVPSLNWLESLEWFEISNNYLGSGQVTDLNFVSSLANATQLQIFSINYNNFGGIFPSVICCFSLLRALQLTGNKIGGQIPTCIQNLTSLQYLRAGHNNLSGAIPSSLGKLTNLGYLNLEDNYFSGYIPPSLGNLTKLSLLSLSTNHLQGHIPSTMGSYKNLQELDLSQNNLSGGITLQLLSLSGSVKLNLSNNPLGGSLPSQVGELKNLNSLDVSSSRLTGEIPSTLGECVSLKYIYMSGNFFHGPIPPSLSSLKSLKELDLSHNNLSEKIPSFLASFQLQMLNLSYNNLEGEVPIGVIFSNASGLSLDGNSGLCGGMAQLKLPPCILSKNRGHHRWRFIITSLLGFVGVVLLVGFISVYSFCHKKKRKEPEAELGTSSLQNLSYQNLLKATNGFSPENVIGRGAFGVVYKGNFNEDQTTFAIKVFNLEHRGATKTFNSECQVLKNVRHRNLLKVITVCSSTDHRGNDFKALVYQYMVNRSLDDWLHQKPTDANGPGDAPKNLNLLERLNVAVDVAFALEHLHHRNGEVILHCDLKPSNILFDDGMVAHIGDFGLAKFLFNGIHANQSSSVGVRGTVGYSPPEYGVGNEPSTYGDVYSFGILLLEMLTGRRPTDNMFKEGVNLHGFVKATFPNHVMDILDQAVVKDIVGEETNTPDYSPLVRNRDSIMVVVEEVTSVLEIALSCSDESPQERLDMSDVSAKMSSIRNKLLGTHLQRRAKPNMLTCKDPGFI